MNRPEEIPDFVRSLPEIDLPFGGAKGWLLQGTNQQVVFLEFSESVEVPEHFHEEQWEFVLAGSVVLHVADTSTRYHAGQNFFIPARVPHRASVDAGYRAMIVFNEPDRYRARR